LFEPGLFQDTSQRSDRKVRTGLTGHGDGASLDGMSQLAMASVHSHDLPSVAGEKPKHVAHFRGATMDPASHTAPEWMVWIEGWGRFRRAWTYAVGNGACGFCGEFPVGTG
jgi:hypothetical protein